MKTFMKILKRIIFGLILIIYFGAAILVSTLVLNRNDFGLTQFGDKILVPVDSATSNENYLEGSLVVVKQKDFSKLLVGEEIFVYEKNSDYEALLIEADLKHI